jgi:hypothetical protein
VARLDQTHKNEAQPLKTIKITAKPHFKNKIKLQDSRISTKNAIQH